MEPILFNRFKYVVLVILIPILGSSRTLESAVVINEISYNPSPVTDSESASGVVDSSDFEFVELFNSGAETIALHGWQFAEAVTFTFGAGASIPSGGYLLIVRDSQNFPVRYPGIQMDGDFSGRLANEGETLILKNAAGTIVEQVTYGPASGWPQFANGLGGTLARRSYSGDASDPGSWAGSRQFGGTPGSENLIHPGPIVINEVLPHTDPPLEDAIEIKNISDQTINTAGWFLTDSLDEPRKFAIPAPAQMLPGAYKVLYQQQFDAPNNPRIPFSLNSYRGDDLYLIQADTNGRLIRISDNIHFPPTENGTSFGRYPDGSGPMMNLSGMTFGTDVSRLDPPLAINLFRQGTGAPNAQPAISPVILYAIHYAPLATLPEFVQIKNISDLPQSLYDPLHPENSWGLDGGISISLPPGLVLEAGNSLIFCESSPEICRAAYSIPGHVPVFGPWSGKLNNSGEDLVLYKPDPPQTSGPDIGLVPRIQTDALVYLPSDGWPDDVIESGAFLQRNEPVEAAVFPSSWRSAREIQYSDSPTDSPLLLSIYFISKTEVEARYEIGTPGNFTVETSVDFKTWLPGNPIVGPAQGTMLFRPLLDRSGQRYFRIRSL